MESMIAERNERTRRKLRSYALIQDDRWLAATDTSWTIITNQQRRPTSMKQLFFALFRFFRPTDFMFAIFLRSIFLPSNLGCVKENKKSSGIWNQTPELWIFTILGCHSCIKHEMLIEEAHEFLWTAGLLKFSNCFCFNLTDAFACHFENVSNFF